jgi:MSHA biogenesis protein MshE
VDIALSAAMTGHFVYSTLHTNDSASAATRLLDMGAEPFVVSSVLKAVLAQRLIRRICANCIKDIELTPQELIWLKAINGEEHILHKFKKGMGCTYCNNTGFFGQVGVFEFLEITPELADALRLKKADEFLKLVYKNEKFVSLLDYCLELTLKDITTITEIIRIMGEISDESPVNLIN